MKKAYLVLYNAACLCGWVYTLALTLQHCSKGTAEVWQHIRTPLTIAQTAAVLEPLHSLTGIVRSPFMTAVMQVCSRLFVVWGVLHAVPHETTTSSVSTGFSLGGIPMELNLITLMLAWCPTEIIRYTFYLAKELGVTLSVVQWLRYTTFIVLYPLGVASELALVWLALPVIQRDHLLSLDMPNAWNFAFDYYRFCCGVVLGYLPGFAQLYSYMFRQRRKYLLDTSKKLA